MSWTDERVDLLSRLWLDGRSASQIATELGLGVTRNAVIGKVHRLGLAGRPKTIPSVPTAPVRSKAKPATRPEAELTAVVLQPEELPVAAVLQTYVKPPSPSFSEVVIPATERVTIMDLRESSCRWPMGDPTSAEFRYCGARSPVGNGPYCATHSRLAFQPPQDRRRERTDRYARIT